MLQNLITEKTTTYIKNWNKNSLKKIIDIFKK